MKSKVLLITFSILLSSLAFSQAKNEKEERVDLNKFPKDAITVIKTLPKNCKRLRYHKETDGTKESFEAKFKYKKQRFSLELNLEGIIEDIELTIKLKQLEENIKSQIESYFKNNYKKARHIKLQKQYVYDSTQDPTEFLNKVLSKESKSEVNYEIITEVKTGSKRDIREFTFDKDGLFLSFKIINPDSYEHALY
ncbi:hypothetical protein [Winogradskyella sp. PG-2]|uniref:hypothetical protein n=1 Tax=Winogradskyella sp. PG-2 TaxID=754409 RepID=UPI0004588726|nr:hypothetical protein [Winogradskyella sp. PG-2]BAO75880.1 hypothetical protein WPG_1650 [Winogradskyella sp. PG-2]